MIMTHSKRFTMARSWIKSLVEDATGMYIYKRTELEIGACLQNDISRFIGTNISVVLDVGANIGQSAIQYNHWFANATVYSFEPFPDTYKALKVNTSRVPNIMPLNIALSDTNEILKVLKSDISCDSTNSLRTSASDCDEEVARISCMCLDSWLNDEDIKHIDFMKVDVEGYELQVIAGAEQTFRESKVSLALFEVGIGSSNTWNTSLTLVIEAMNSYGYELIGFYDTSLVQLQNRSHYTNALFASSTLINSLPPLTREIKNKCWPFQDKTS
jgi:FkbM family methyltransferase